MGSYTEDLARLVPAVEDLPFTEEQAARAAKALDDIRGRLACEDAAAQAAARAEQASNR